MQLWSGPAIYMFDASKGYISHFFIWFEQTVSSDLEQPGTPQNEVWFLNMTGFLLVKLTKQHYLHCSYKFSTTRPCLALTNFLLLLIFNTCRCLFLFLMAINIYSQQPSSLLSIELQLPPTNLWDPKIIYIMLPWSSLWSSHTSARSQVREDSLQSRSYPKAPSFLLPKGSGNS